jgi:hypothetical protein
MDESHLFRAAKDDSCARSVWHGTNVWHLAAVHVCSVCESATEVYMGS